MKIKIDTDNLVKLLKPSLFWDEVGLIAPLVDGMFGGIDEPNVEDIAAFIDSLVLVKKRENEDSYNALKVLYENGLREIGGFKYSYIYNIDFEAEVAVCGSYY